jgi:deoxyhypusine synthase
VEHIDIKSINAVDIIQAMKKMSFSARDLAKAADIYDRMLFLHVLILRVNL